MDATRINALLVEDSEADAGLLRAALERVDPQRLVDITQVPCVKDAIGVLACTSFEIIILELDLTDAHGLDTLVKIRRAGPDTPIIVLTRLDDDGVASDAVRLGAQDYLIKSKVSGASIFRCVRYAIERCRSASELGKASLRLKRSNQEITALLECSRCLLQKTDFQETAQVILKKSMELVGSESGFLSTSGESPSDPDLVRAAAGAFSGAEGRETPKVMKAPLERAFAAASPFIENSADWTESAVPASQERFQGNLLVVPLMRDTQPAGALVLTNKPGGFVSEDVRVASSLAEFAMIGLSQTRTSEALGESERRMRMLADAAPIGIFIAGQGVIRYVNPALVRMLEYNSPGDLTERDVDEICGPEHGRELWERSAQRSEELELPPHFRVKAVTAKGATLDLEAWDALLGTGANPLWLVFLVDVTEAVSLRAQLLQAQKMESLGTLAGGIAHDFNNLLTVILGFSELLMAEKRPGERDYEDLRKIMQAARNGADLVQRILTFSRKIDIRPRHIDLNKEVAQARKLLMRTIPKSIEISLDLQPDLKQALADPGQIEQILLNLAVNSRDAMPGGGRFSLRTRNVFLDEAYCKLHFGASPGEYVLLGVSDTGAGMSSAVREHIFEPFFTTKKPGEGTGLGLAMVYGIVKNHGGLITCKSETGQGAEFRIYLPAIESELTEEVSLDSASQSGGDECILLVDDEALVREIGAKLLTKVGYQVRLASDGREALEILEAQGDCIALVVLDLIMPVMDGSRCLEEIQKADPSTKVIIASGVEPEGWIKQAIDKGELCFVSKPFEVMNLLAAVRDALDKK